MATKTTATAPMPNFPVINVDALVAVQGKNVEALTQAGRVVVEGAHAVARRQVEIAQDNLKATVAEVEAMLKAGPKLELDVDKAKAAYQTAIAQAEELYGIAAKARKEAFDILNARALANLDEVGKLAA